MADIPDTIGKYKNVSLIARGGMGAVYKAVHPTLKRNVIIKKLTIRGNASMIERFKREAQILMDLNDPRIVHLFDYFKEGTSHYIVLEFVDGMSLDMLLKKRRYLSGVLSLYIFLDVCKALKYAHDHGVIHRDIKPGNILISRNGNVKLADFGIAAIDEEGGDELTKEGMTLGTAAYMPPEQFKNSRNVDKRADVYAMGVMLYEMVTGKKPFPGNFAPETLLAIQKGKYVKAKRINPDTPKVISRLIGKMIRPIPKKRFQDMEKAIRIIEKFLRRYPLEAVHKTLVESMGQAGYEEPVFKPRTKKREVALVFAVLLLAAGGAAYRAWTGGYIHRYFLADSFGALAVTVTLPSSIKDAEDVFLKAKLYVNDRKDFPEADAEPFRFTLGDRANDARAYLFRSEEIFARPGRYRLKVFVEQRIYWYSFTLASLSELKKKGKTEELVSINFDKIEQEPVLVRTECFDALSGRNITSAARFEVLEGGSWIPLGDIPAELLVTGTVRKFRATNPDYYGEEFSLKIAPYQSELVLRASLVPLPGTLALVTPDGPIDLTLNGSKTITLGGEEMRKASLAGFQGGTQTWSLPSGRYELGVSKGNKHADEAFIVENGKTVEITVSVAAGVLRIRKE